MEQENRTLDHGLESNSLPHSGKVQPDQKASQPSFFNGTTSKQKLLISTFHDGEGPLGLCLHPIFKRKSSDDSKVEML